MVDCEEKLTEVQISDYSILSFCCEKGKVSGHSSGYSEVVVRVIDFGRARGIHFWEASENGLPGVCDW